MIFSIGLCLFVPFVLVALFCGMARVSAPEWLELIGGGAILFGVVLMTASALWRAVSWFPLVLP